MASRRGEPGTKYLEHVGIEDSPPAVLFEARIHTLWPTAVARVYLHDLDASDSR